MPYASTSTTTKYEVGGTYNGSLISTVVTTNVAPDSTSGEIYDSTTTTTESATSNGISQGQSWTSRTYVTSLLNDTTNWCLGRPSQVQQTNSHTMTGGVAQTRTTSTSWDVVNCRPYQTIVEPNTTLAVTTGIQYDGFGNPTIQTVTGYGMTARTTTTGWSADGRFPISVTNALGHTATASFYQDTGLPYQATDPNGLTSTIYYDNFGRNSQETRPDGTYTTFAVVDCPAPYRCGDGLLRGYRLVQNFAVGGASINYQYLFFDAFERVKYDERLNLNATLSQIYTIYDSLGRKPQESLPYFNTGGPSGYVTTTYDVLGRPLTVSRPTSASNSTPLVTSMAYQGLTVTSTDPQLKVKTTKSDAIGQTRQSLDHNGYYQLFQFDAFGNPIQVTDGDGKTLQSATFNVRGMRTQSIDADMGTWNYYYNALGELTSQTDAKSQSIAFTYDLLGRPLTKTEPGPSSGTVTSTWTWGNNAPSKNIGRLYSVSIGGTGVTTFTETRTYDSLGRESLNERSDGTIYAAINTTYNSTTGLMDSITYPTSTSGYRLTAVYEYQYGKLLRVKQSPSQGSTTYWQANAENPSGTITDETLGNGLRTVRTIDNVNGNLTNISTGPSGGSSRQNLNYVWDTAGNLTSRNDANQGVTENFVYDNLYRLTSATVTGQTAQTVTYANNGNILSKSDVGSYTYSPTKIHAVTAAGGATYGYDANGNLTNKNGALVTWYASNKLASISQTGASSSFEYTPSGQYWKQNANYSNGTETTWYIGGMMEIVASTINGITSYRHHIQANGRIVAIVNRGSNGANNTVYPLTDHLGGVESITDSAGAIIVKESFDPWGKRRGANWVGLPSSTDLTNIANNTRRGYTGHTMLDNVGLVHMNGRVYDPVLGRFLSADPFIQYPEETQSWNRYSYVFNNPLSYVDPSGYFSLKKFFRNFVRAVVAIVSYVVANIVCVGPENAGCVAKVFTVLNTAGQYALTRRWASRGPASNPFGNIGTPCNWGGCGGPRSIGGARVLSANSGTGTQCDFGPCDDSVQYQTDVRACVGPYGYDLTGSCVFAAIIHEQVRRGQMDQAEGDRTIADYNSEQLETVAISIAGMIVPELLAARFAQWYRAWTAARTAEQAANAAKSAAALGRAGQVADRAGLTRAGRALAKHGGREGSVFPRATGNPGAINAQGQAALDDILGNVTKSSSNKYGGTDYFGGRLGAGARYDQAGNFMGFLEP